MLNTWIFMIFIIVSFIIYWTFVPVKWRSAFLALISFGYTYCYYPKGVMFLLGLALLVYLAGKILLMGAGRRRWLMIMSVLGLIGSLAYFKYTAFLIEIFNPLLTPILHSTLQVPEVFVPIGISYFTFKMIHYIVELNRGNIEEHSIADFLSYILFFPILISGPIERFQPFLAQIKAGEGFSLENINAGMPRIISGLFKKIVLADSLALTAVFLQQQDLAVWQYWLGSFAYTLQLYFDFSGYSDMAIGISRLFGFKIMENFNWPYLSANVSDFWKRWHMSLTGWFRDYLFIPLGGSRVGLTRIIINTLIVMAVTGLWHGAAWHFVFWGMYHGIGLILLRLYRKFVLPGLKARTSWFDSGTARALGVFLTFNFVNIGWIFFACEADQSIYVLQHLFGL